MAQCPRKGHCASLFVGTWDEKRTSRIIGFFHFKHAAKAFRLFYFVLNVFSFEVDVIAGHWCFSKVFFLEIVARIKNIEKMIPKNINLWKLSTVCKCWVTLISFESLPLLNSSTTWLTHAIVLSTRTHKCIHTNMFFFVILTPLYHLRTPNFSGCRVEFCALWVPSQCASIWRGLRK